MKNYVDASRSKFPAALVVEGEEDIAQMIGIALEGLGFDVDVADDVARARKMALGSYALFVVDMHLGGGSGYEFVVELRDHLVAANIPIVICSARHSPSDIVAGLDAGADDFVSRPVSMPSFTARVQALMRRRKVGL